MATIIKRNYKVKLANGSTEVRECEHWTIQYRDPAGKLKRIKGYKDKGATKQLAAKLERNQARGEMGLVDPFKVHRARPLAEHVKDYVADLTASGRDEMYVANMQNRLNRLMDSCAWTCLADIEPASFQRWREADRKDEGKRHGRLAKGSSATTLNQYLDTARAFTNWCASNSRMEGIAIAGGKKMATALASVAKVDGEKRRQRRALTDEQVTNLIDKAPAERAIVYRIAMAIGLRRSELEQLKWGDLRLNAINPCVQLRAEATKARRGDRIPLPQTLAAEMRKIKPADISDAAAVFPCVPCIETWKGDLTAAGIVYKDEMGRQADFHGGTRKTLNTRMHRAGVPLAVAMRVMRHADAKLTMVDYVDDEQLGSGGAALPELLPSAAQAPAVAAIG